MLPPLTDLLSTCGKTTEHLHSLVHRFPLLPSPWSFVRHSPMTVSVALTLFYHALRARYTPFLSVVFSYYSFFHSTRCFVLSSSHLALHALPCYASRFFFDVLNAIIPSLSHHAFDHTFPTSSSQESFPRRSRSSSSFMLHDHTFLAPRHTSRSLIKSSFRLLLPASFVIRLPHHGSSSRLPPWTVRYDHLH